MNQSDYVKDLLRRNLNLVDEGKYAELLLLVPYPQRTDVVKFLQECNIDINSNITEQLVGLHPTATEKEKELYDYSISLGCVDDTIMFNGTSGVSIRYKNDYKFNIIDRGGGNFYCYIQSLHEGKSSKEFVKFSKVKTILKRATSGYQFSYVIK